MPVYSIHLESHVSKDRNLHQLYKFPQKIYTPKNQIQFDFNVEM